MMQPFEPEVSITLMCRCLKVARSGYYQWKTHARPHQERNRKRLHFELGYLSPEAFELKQVS